MVTKKALSKIRKSIGGIIDIATPNEENAQKVLEFVMPDLDPNDLATNLRYYYKYLSTAQEDDEGNVTYDERYKAYFDPLPALFSKYTLIQKHMGLSIRVGRTWWPLIQDYIRNPNYVLEMVGRKKPVIKQMLSTDLGQHYLQYYTERLFTFFQLFFWKFPRYHNECGGLILYGLVDKVGNSWGWFCRRCNTPISLDDIDELTYQKRKYQQTDVSSGTDGKQEYTQQDS